jgi:hypothetical protein
MATGKSQSAPTNRWRNAKWSAAIVVAIFAVWLIYSWGSLRANAEVATGYAARVGCSCHFIGKRDLKSCATDLEPGMEMVTMSLDPEKPVLHASVPLLAERSAEFREGWGCVMLDKKDQN